MEYIFLFSEKTDSAIFYLSIALSPLCSFSPLPFILKNLFEEAITGSEKGVFFIVIVLNIPQLSQLILSFSFKILQIVSIIPQL